ncbi:hypothetical protein [Sphingopyxis granuli]|uniref:hypothetical protein n=1 Tax=Sphingopyxis granuli TaxID=267128 RepID=UPI00301DF62D
MWTLYTDYMPTQSKRLCSPEPDLWPMIEAALIHHDGAAAREHLAAGFPIYYSEVDTPADVVIKEFPDGHRELVRFDHDGEHRVAALV